MGPTYQLRSISRTLGTSSLQTVSRTTTSESEWLTLARAHTRSTSARIAPTRQVVIRRGYNGRFENGQFVIDDGKHRHGDLF